MASLRDRLAAQREAHLAPKTLVLPLPGWTDPRVLVRYRPVEWERLLDLLGAPGEDAKATLKANLDALASACEALLVRDEGDPEPTSLADALRAQGESVHGEVRFDEYAVDVLGLQVKGEDGVLRAPKSAAETVLAAFGGAVSPELAVAEHAATLGAWMRGVASQEDAESLGG